jgi:hypothetical protein
MGIWAGSFHLVFPKLSRQIAEGDMLRPNSKNSVYRPSFSRVIMPAISTIVPVVGSVKFVHFLMLGNKV